LISVSRFYVLFYILEYFFCSATLTVHVMRSCVDDFVRIKCVIMMMMMMMMMMNVALRVYCFLSVSVTLSAAQTASTKHPNCVGSQWRINGRRRGQWEWPPIGLKNFSVAFYHVYKKAHSSLCAFEINDVFRCSLAPPSIKFWVHQRETPPPSL